MISASLLAPGSVAARAICRGASHSMYSAGLCVAWLVLVARCFLGSGLPPVCKFFQSNGHLCKAWDVPLCTSVGSMGPALLSQFFRIPCTYLLRSAMDFNRLLLVGAASCPPYLQGSGPPTEAAALPAFPACRPVLDPNRPLPASICCVPGRLLLSRAVMRAHQLWTPTGCLRAVQG